MTHDPTIFAFIAAIDRSMWIAMEITRTEIEERGDRYITGQVFRKSVGMKAQVMADIEEEGKDILFTIFHAVTVGNILQQIYLPANQYTYDYYDSMEDLMADHLRELL